MKGCRDLADGRISTKIPISYAHHTITITITNTTTTTNMHLDAIPRRQSLYILSASSTLSNLRWLKPTQPATPSAFVSSHRQHHHHYTGLLAFPLGRIIDLLFYTHHSRRTHAYQAGLAFHPHLDQTSPIPPHCSTLTEHSPTTSHLSHHRRHHI